MRINYAALALIGGALCAQTDAYATSIDLGNVIATFDESSFLAIGTGQPSSVNMITFMLGPSISVNEGAATADFSAHVDFAPKPGITVTGFNLSGFGSANTGTNATATLSGTLGEVTINGDTSTTWQSNAVLGAAAGVSVAGTLTAQGGTFTTFEQIGSHIEQHIEITTIIGVIGQEFGVVGHHEEFSGSIEVFDGFDLVGDPDGNVIKIPRYHTEPQFHLVDDFGLIDIFGPIPVFSTLDVEVPDFGDILHNTPAAIALDSFSIEAVVVPLPTAQLLFGTGLGLLTWINRRRRTATSAA